MVLSDNIATNQIIDVVGMDRVRDFCKEKGLYNTWIWQKMIHQGPPPADMPAGLIPNATTAADLGVLMEQIVAETIVSPASCRKIKVGTAVNHIQLETVLCTKKTDTGPSLNKMPHLLPGNLLWGTAHPFLQNSMICTKKDMLRISELRAQALLYLLSLEISQS